MALFVNPLIFTVSILITYVVLFDARSIVECAAEHTYASDYSQ